MDPVNAAPPSPQSSVVALHMIVVMFVTLDPLLGVSGGSTVPVMFVTSDLSVGASVTTGSQVILLFRSWGKLYMFLFSVVAHKVES